MNADVHALREGTAGDVSPVVKRLEELRQDWTTGQRRLESLDAERQRLRETLLRIAGAIQVLEEFNGGAEAAASMDAT